MNEKEPFSVRSLLHRRDGMSEPPQGTFFEPPDDEDGLITGGGRFVGGLSIAIALGLLVWLLA